MARNTLRKLSAVLSCIPLLGLAACMSKEEASGRLAQGKGIDVYLRIDPADKCRAIATINTVNGDVTLMALRFEECPKKEAIGHE